MESFSLVFFFLGCLCLFGNKPIYYKAKALVFLFVSGVFFIGGKKQILQSEEESILYLGVFIFLFSFASLYVYFSTAQSANMEDLNDFDD